MKREQSVQGALRQSKNDGGGTRSGRGMGKAHRLVLIATGLVLSFSDAHAHPGGLNGEGCHNNRKTGDYHCHRSGGGQPSGYRPSTSSASSALQPSDAAGAPFPNCAAARAAGAAPVRRGDPGYSSRLDRDGDGIGCE